MSVRVSGVHIQSLTNPCPSLLSGASKTEVKNEAKKLELEEMYRLARDVPYSSSHDR